MATKGAKRKAASKARAQFSSDPKYESCFKPFPVIQIVASCVRVIFAHILIDNECYSLWILTSVKDLKFCCPHFRHVELDR